MSLVAAPANAQQTGLDDKDKSVVQFEINIDKIVNSELGKLLDFEGKIQSAPGLGEDDMDPSTISRVYGSLSLPDNIAAFQGMGPGSPLPMEVFSRVVFKSSEEAASAIGKMTEKSEEVSIGGKTFIKPTGEDAPEGMLAQKIDDKTIEMGTEKYLTRADREVTTDALKSAWGKTPKDAVRIVVDVDGMEALKAEIIDVVDQTQPQIIAYVELLNNITDLRITFDLEGDNLMTLSATGKDEELAEEFADGLNSLLVIGQMTVKGQAANAPSDAAGDVMNTIADALEAKYEGKEVMIKIPRPEGFNDVVQEMLPPGF
jgi:hypothetical protein